MTFLFITPSISSSILLFGVMTTTTTVAESQKVRFGRSIRDRSPVSPSSASLQRIRDVSVLSPKAPLQIDDTGDSTLKHRRTLTSKSPMFSDMLVFEMSSYSMSMSLPSSFEFDFDTPTISTDPTNTASTLPSSTLLDITTMPPTSDHAAETHYVKIMIEYLSECAGLELDTNTCLVSSTIDQLLSFETDIEMGHRRFLQSSNHCVPPPITEQTMRSIMTMTIAKDQCSASTSDDEFNAVLDTFMGVFSATECWESLCNSDAAIELLMRILFDDAAQCAGVELDVHKCVYDHIIEMLVMTNAPSARSLRRVLQQQTEESSDQRCATPSETEINIFVSTLLNDSKDKCIASGFDLDLESSTNYWESVSSDLATIFSSPNCWGVSGCQPEEESSVPVVAASVVEGVRSIHVPSTSTTTVSTGGNADDVPVMDDPTTFDPKHDTVVGDKSKIHNAVFVATAAGGLVAIAVLVVGLRRSMSTTSPKENVIPVDEKSTDGSSDDQSSDGHHTADLSWSMTSV